MDNTVELLKKLTSTVGVSGEEENIVTLLKDILKKYGNVSVDSMNNVYCTFGQGYHFLLDASAKYANWIQIAMYLFYKFGKMTVIYSKRF